MIGGTRDLLHAILGKASVSEPQLDIRDSLRIYGESAWFVGMEAERDRAMARVRAAYDSIPSSRVPRIACHNLEWSEPVFPLVTRLWPDGQTFVPLVVLPDPVLARAWAVQHEREIKRRMSDWQSSGVNGQWYVTRYFEASNESAGCVGTPLSWLTPSSEAMSEAWLERDLVLGRASQKYTVLNRDPNYPSSCGAGRSLGAETWSRDVERGIIQVGSAQKFDWESTKLAFPILDANGGARDPATDRYAAQRHGPYQCIVESPDFDPRIGTHSLLILPWPESPDPRLQRPARVQERLCIHEDMAKLDPPIITVRTLPGSAPFREDYLLQAECDFESADDLVMVVIFASTTPEQLSRLFESLANAARAQSNKEAQPNQGALPSGGAQHPSKD